MMYAFCIYLMYPTALRDPLFETYIFHYYVLDWQRDNSSSLAADGPVMTRARCTVEVILGSGVQTNKYKYCQT